MSLLSAINDLDQMRLVGGASTTQSTVVGPVLGSQTELYIYPPNPGIAPAIPPSGPGAAVVQLTTNRKPGDGTLWSTSVTTGSPF